MTEQQWLASSDPAAMLAFLTNSIRGVTYDNPSIERGIPLASDRKLRLFARACMAQLGIKPEDVAATEEKIVDPTATAVAWCHNSQCSQQRADLLRHIIGNPFRPWNAVACGRCNGDGKAHGSDRPFKFNPKLSECPLCHGRGWSPGPVSHFSTSTLKLAEALYKGEDCAFALHDSLLEDGEAELVEHFDDVDCPKCRGNRYISDASKVLADFDSSKPMLYEDLRLYLAGVRAGIINCKMCECKTGKVKQEHPKGCWVLDIILEKS